MADELKRYSGATMSQLMPNKDGWICEAAEAETIISSLRQRVAELEGEVERLAVRNKEADDLILKTAVSHSKMAHAEYLRNPGYHNTHFSYLAEMDIIEYLEKYGIWNAFLGLIKEDENNG